MVFKELVLKETGVTSQEEGKLGPKWKRPYVVTACHKPKAYWLKDVEGKELQRPWNAEHIKKYFA